MTREELRPAVQRLLAERHWTELRALISTWEAPDIADLLKELDRTDRAVFFRMLPKPLSAEVFSYLETKDRDTLLLDMTDAEVRDLLAGLSPDDRTEVLDELPGQVTQRLLNLLDPAELQQARTLLGYPPETVGRLMTPNYVAVRPDWTVGQALEHIRRRGRDSETINHVYIVDDAWQLLDDIPLRRLILADPTQRVAEVMDQRYVTLSPFDDREKAVQVVERYDLEAVPVVDSDGVLLGIVTIDDLLEVAEKEATEDFHKLASVQPLKMSYWSTPLWMLYRLRIGWLAALVLVNLASSGVIAAFEQTLAAMIALAFFIPLIIDTGGNAGTQSATIMIRALSTGDVRLQEWARVLLRELAIGASIGVTLGALGALLGLYRGGPEMGLLLGLVVFLTMVTMLVVTNLIGMGLPFILARVRQDPAVASGPLITSIADVVGLLIYFSIATAVLGQLGDIDATAMAIGAR